MRAETGSSRPSVWDDRPRIDKAGQNRRSDGWKSDVYCQPRQQSYAEGQQGDAGASTDDENGGTGGNTPVEPENGQNGANSEQENGQQTSGDGDDAAGQETSGDDERKTEEQVSDSDTIYPEKTTRAIVDCDGALNLRRSASWGNESICGRAVRGQSYYIKAIHTVEGKKMLETIDGIFLSGQPEHVRIIEV